MTSQNAPRGQQTKLDDLALVKLRWLILRGLRTPLIVAAGLCLFVDLYGVPTWRKEYHRDRSGARHVSYPLDFRPLDRPAAVVGGEWLYETFLSE